MKDKGLLPIRPQIQRLVESGRAAIGKRLIRAVLSPIDKENIDAEVKQITALLDKYNGRMRSRINLERLAQQRRTRRP